MNNPNITSEDKVKCIPTKYPKEVALALLMATNENTEYGGMMSPYIRKQVIKALIRDGYLMVREKPISAFELEKREKQAQTFYPKTRQGSRFGLKFINPFKRRKLRHLEGPIYYSKN